MMGCNSVKVKSPCHFFQRTQKADFSRLQYFYKSSQAEQRSGVCLMEVQYFWKVSIYLRSTTLPLFIENKYLPANFRLLFESYTSILMLTLIECKFKYFCHFTIHTICKFKHLNITLEYYFICHTDSLGCNVYI